ncbi:MAG: M28 family metallopeptidase [Pseudomonadota bacterium]
MASIRVVYLFALVWLAACSVPPTTTSTDREFDREVALGVFSEHVAALSADRMQGRSPASVGEQRTLDYLTAAYREVGLSPVPELGFLQSVPLVGITPSSTSALSIRGDHANFEFAYRRDAMLWTKRLVAASSIDDSPLVFAGYGIVAPEYDWNDYAGLDVSGKTVVVLVNDPGFATRDESLFNGYAMTYYGRWTYKYEEAARQGAAGILIVHENEAAGYPWQVVAGSWAGESFDLVAPDRNMGRASIEGWLSLDAAQRLFAAAGLDYEEQRDRASTRGFKAVDLTLTASATVTNEIAESESYNAIGYLPGSRYPDEYIVYTAHWDHLGMSATTEPRNFAANSSSDTIFNGAKDNAAGVAMMLSLARAFAAGEPPERSVVFLAVTAEESGLLGSAWYAAEPVFPLETTVANINIDAPTLLGPTRDVTVVGFGNSELQELLATFANRQGRELRREPTPEKGFFYRSDHFNFAKRGVPALYAKGGIDHRERGVDYGSAWEADYVANRYHKVGDEYDANWDLRGVAEDIELYYQVGASLAGSRDWPDWYPGNEFKAARDASADSRL